MADPVRGVLTPDETFAVLTQVARDKGDSFKLKVQRKRSLSALPESIAVFEQAQVEHLVTPESWLPRLFGGGPTFVLSAYHTDEVTKLVGGLITVQVPGDPRDEIDFDLINRADWKGPKQMTFPMRPPAPQQDRSLYGVIPSASSHGVVPRPEPTTAGGRDLSSFDKAAFEELKQRELLLAKREKDIEISAIKEQGEARVRELAARLDRQEMELRESRRVAALPPPAPPPALPTGPSAGEVVATLLKEVGPLAIAFLKQSSDQRSMMAKIQSDQQMAMAKMQADQQASLAMLQQQSSAKQAETSAMLMQALLTKPPIDPVVQAMLAKDDTSSTLTPMIEAMGMMSQTTMNLIAAASEMGLGGGHPEKESPMLTAFREGTKALIALQGGFGKAAAGHKRRPALPAAQPQAPSQQVFSQPASSPQPMPQAAAPTQELHASEPDVIDEVMALIRSRSMVPEEAAAAILKQLNTEEAQSALEATLVEHGGDLGELFNQRLGDWMAADDSNREYAQQTILSFIQQGAKVGMIPQEFVEQAEAMVDEIGVYDEAEESEDDSEDDDS